MKIFWKVFGPVFISFVLLASLIAYVSVSGRIQDTESRIIGENDVIAGIVAKDIESASTGTGEIPETLERLDERNNFLFWWIVGSDGRINLSDNATFTGARARSYFPGVPENTGEGYTLLDEKTEHGIVIKPVIAGGERREFWLGFSVSEIPGMVNSIVYLNLAVFVLMSALLGMVLYFTVTNITRPIARMIEASIRISKGNLDIPVSVHTGDELEEMASSFNLMAKELKASHEEIKGRTAELEKNVQQRTTDLDQKINELTNTKTAVLNMMEDMEKTNSELIETQEQLKKSMTKLEDVDAKKDEFISIAAHELKTPLTSIHGFSQLLKNTSVSDNREKRNKYLEIMDHESKRLANLVNEILDLSRIDLGTIKFVFEEIDVNKLVEDIRKEMDFPIKAAGLHSEYRVEKNLPKMVTDRERLTQVIINLVNNAVKYTPKGNITVTVKKDDKDIHLSVRDTGLGIAKENQEKIFERFYQVDSSYTRKAGGTGLGLSLCQEFVTMLGGKIWVDSELEKGSEFHFTLPLKGPPEEMVLRAEGARKPEENPLEQKKPGPVQAAPGKPGEKASNEASDGDASGEKAGKPAQKPPVKAVRVPGKKPDAAKEAAGAGKENEAEVETAAAEAQAPAKEKKKNSHQKLPGEPAKKGKFKGNDAGK